MKINKSHISNLVVLVFIILMIIPQTRQSIQVGLHSVLGLFSPSETNKEDQAKISSYDWQLLDSSNNQFDFNQAKGKVVFINVRIY